MGELFAGRFELVESLAAGGMGEVWTARDHRDGRVVAVKLLQQADAGGLLRFLREQGVRIHHPHVMTPLSWAGMDDRVLFSMPLATGGSVATLIGDYGPLPTRFVAELLRQTLSGLAAVHAEGVVHRDLKPANLLLDATGTGRPRLRISDFGLALPLEAPRLTTVASVIGTPGYQAPEVLAQADPSPAQDLYAVGVIGREMLTGVRPDPHGTPPGAGGDVPRSGLWPLLDSLIDADPARRPAASEALALLDTPSLAWEVQDDIDVLPQVLGDGRVPEPAPPALERADALRTTRAPSPRALVHSNIGPLVLVSLGTLVLLGVLLVTSLP